VPKVRQGCRRLSLDLRERVLAPYSPDFNPIEKAFAKLKAALRKAAQHTVDELWDTIGRPVNAFTPKACANSFTACGYDAD